MTVGWDIEKESELNSLTISIIETHNKPTNEPILRVHRDISIVVAKHCKQTCEKNAKESEWISWYSIISHLAIEWHPVSHSHHFISICLSNSLIYYTVLRNIGNSTPYRNIFFSSAGMVSNLAQNFVSAACFYVKLRKSNFVYNFIWTVTENHLVLIPFSCFKILVHIRNIIVCCCCYCCCLLLCFAIL